MNFIVRGEKIEVTDSIREYVIDKLSKLEKYFDNPKEINAKVLISVRGREQKVEVTINCKGYDLRAEVSHSDLYAAIDLILDKLERQIRKYKTKIMSRERVEIVYDDYVEDDEIQDVVKRKKVYLKPMDEEEAKVQMELLDHTFFIYKDIDTEKVNVMYKRYDGTYGVIETN